MGGMGFGGCKLARGAVQFPAEEYHEQDEAQENQKIERNELPQNACARKFRFPDEVTDLLPPFGSQRDQMLASQPVGPAGKSRRRDQLARAQLGQEAAIEIANADEDGPPANGFRIVGSSRLDEHRACRGRAAADQHDVRLMGGPRSGADAAFGVECAPRLAIVPAIWPANRSPQALHEKAEIAA